MTIAEALRATCQEHALSPEAIAVAGKVTAQGAKNWMLVDAPSTPSGDVLIRLMRELPGFAVRLGFEAATESEAAA